jgi:antitoxin ParD1/3/4
MDKTTLTISLPRMMKEFIDSKVGEGRFSTSSEYVRSLIRDDEDLAGKPDLAVLVRRGILLPSTPRKRNRERSTSK